MSQEVKAEAMTAWSGLAARPEIVRGLLNFIGQDTWMGGAFPYGKVTETLADGKSQVGLRNDGRFVG